MPTRKYHRRSRKTTPLKELGFIAAVVIAALIALGLRQGMEDANLGLVAAAFLLLVLVFGGSFYLWLLYKQQKRQKALRALEIAQVDAMTGEEFEVYVAELLRFQGYKTRMTPRSGDYGVDIVASKNGIKTAVQTKRYTKKLDQDPIREVIAGMTMKQYGCTKSMVVTNSTFTEKAEDLARHHNCELIDREKLAEWILMFRDEMSHNENS